MPAFPPEFPVFDPPVHSDPVSSNAPAIAEWTRQNQPGDTMALSGSGMPSDYAIYAPVYLNTFSTTNWFGEHGALTLPYDLPADTMYLLWPIANDVAGAPVAINKTETWWLTETASAGARFSIFGRNLGTDCKVWVEEEGQWLNSVASNPYKADFLVPSDYANGTYTLWVHNGKGRAYGWADSLILTVAAKDQWNDDTSTWYDVMSYGASGNGIDDDYAEIDSAINAALAAGDWKTVYFPAGTYTISSKLGIGWNGSKIRLVGAGMDSVTIRPHSSASSMTYIVHNHGDDVQLKNMTLKANGYGGEQIVLMDVECQDWLFDDVRLDQFDAEMSYPRRPDLPENTETSDKVFKVKGAGLTMLNCEFIVKGSLLFDEATQIFVSNCTFIGTWDANTLLTMEDSQDFSIVDCVASNLDSSASEDDVDVEYWCQGRWLHGKGGMRNLYFSGNATYDMTPRTGHPDANVGEQLMFEFAYTHFQGDPTSTTPNSMTFSVAPTSTIVGLVAVIQDGQGQGQNRIVTALNGNTVTVSPAWRVPPTTGSTILIGDYAKYIAVFDNSFDGRDRALGSTFVGNAGIEAYGGCVDLVADNNRFHQVRFPYNVQSRATYKETYEPNFFNLYMNGTISNCYHGIAMYVERDPTHVWSYPQVLGNVYRSNTIADTSAEPIHYHGSWIGTYTGERVDMQVFDNNTCTNYTGSLHEYDRIVAESEVLNQVTIEASASALPPPPDPPPAPTLTGIVISGPTSVDEGTTVQYVCTASYSDGSTAQVAPNWSDNSAAATIDGSGVLFAGDVAADESVTVTASYGGFTDTHNVTIIYVPVVLTGIVVSGPSSVDEETTAQYVCTANYSDGSSAVATPVWSDNSSYATISGSGVLSAGNVAFDQSVTISASFGGQADTYAVTIKYVPPVLVGIAISGSASVDEETTTQYTCTASYSDGTSSVIVPSWSENSSYATISGSGMLTAGNVSSDQSMTVAASFGGQTDTHAVTIAYVPPVLTGITISGPSIVNEETTAQYTCTANYSDGTSSVVVPGWSENSAFATIGASGLLTAGNVASDQSATVSASYEGKSDTHAVLIAYVPPVVTSLAIAGPESIEENTTALYTCTAYYSDGSSAQVNPVWSEDSMFASIDGSGVLSAGNIAADEQVALHASLGGKMATQMLAITAIGDQVVFPLGGFDGKTVSAELWDEAAQGTIDLGEDFEPEEIVIENVNPNQWYWLGLREYDTTASEWVLVHGRWIWM